MRAEDRRHYNEVARRDWPGYDWGPGADIYTYFWTYATTFLKPDGMLVLITQAAWLDVEYGFPVQHWMLENFTILAIMESEAEPWFTDARVATAVTVLKRETDAAARNRNVVRFVQFRNRLEAVFGAQTEDHRLRAVERIRDAILTVEQDQATEQWRVRVVPQSDLLREGLNPQGGYVGSKWGRYLRSIDSVFELQRSRRDRFVELQTLAPIRRGITTNCDDFFLVSDISQPALQRHQGEAAFRQAFGVGRGDVGSGRIAIIRRSDGHEAALERDYLCPIVKTARDFRWFATRHMGVSDVAVVLPENRSELSQLAQAYVRAGEREGWHRNPSFESIRRAGGRWFSLREATVAQILFVKTMQYTPVVLLNDGGFLANQRLYEVTPITGVDGRALCALLNSTVFAAERYAGVKALGREAAIDVEVFSARRFRTPDLRRLPDEQASRLAELMDALGGRQAGPFLEAALVNTSLTAARRYVRSHRVSTGLWPAELRDQTRQEIDKLTLAVLGFREREIPRILNRLYGEVVEYTRKLRMLELQAQINRQGAAAQGPNARQLADDVWAHLRENAILPRSVPEDFVRDVPTRCVRIPPGRVEVLQRTLFEAQEEFACRVGRTRFEFGSAGERECFALLSRLGCVGDVRMPERAEDCARVATQIQTYIDLLSREFGRVTAEITTDVDLQRRIVREGLRQVIAR